MRIKRSWRAYRVKKTRNRLLWTHFFIKKLKKLIPDNLNFNSHADPLLTDFARLFSITKKFSLKIIDNLNLQNFCAQFWISLQDKFFFNKTKNFQFVIWMTQTIRTLNTTNIQMKKKLVQRI